MPPFLSESTFWIFVLAVTVILIFCFGINITDN